MDNQNIYEEIQKLFPDKKAAQIILSMDMAQKRFVSLTGVLRKVGELSSLTSQVTWAVPAGFIRMYEVELYDSDGKWLNKFDEDIDWRIDGDLGNSRLYLTFFDTSTDKKITSIPTSINTIWVWYSSLPTTLADITTGISIEEQFMPAIKAGVLEDYFASTPVPLGVDRGQNSIFGINTNMVGFWGAKFKELVVEAKKWVNAWDSSDRRAQNYQFGGKFVIPQEAKDANISTTAWS